MSDYNATEGSSTQRKIQSLHSPPSEEDHEYYAAYPNRWAFIRKRYIRDFACEFLGEYQHICSHSLSPLMVHSLFAFSLSRYHDDYNVRPFTLTDRRRSTQSDSTNATSLLLATFSFTDSDLGRLVRSFYLQIPESHRAIKEYVIWSPVCAAIDYRFPFHDVVMCGIFAPYKLYYDQSE